MVICAALCAGYENLPRVTPLAVAVSAYVAWAVANDFVNSPYNAAGLFHPALLAGGFALARGLDSEARKSVIRAVLAGMALLAFWALWQAASGQGRAHAYFETPNTLASLLNLALAPLLFRIAFGENRRPVLALAVLLTGALISTLSRGGFIALAGALVATSLFFAVHPSLSGVLRIVTVLALGIIAGAIALQLPPWLTLHIVPAEAQLQGVASTLGGTLDSRMELYRLALSAIGEHPWLGTGYLGFNALFEAGRVQVPSYAAGNVTYFVHNDYLQTLVELGWPGFAGLISTVALPFWLARQSGSRVTDRLSLHAAVAGLGTMAIHALGDFPFYVPICLLLFGSLLGEVDQLLVGGRVATVRATTPRTRLAKIGVATGLAVVLLPPPLAEAAAAYGAHSWRSGHGESAAFGFELARRFQPRDWRYHWYAAQFWYAEAAETGRKAPANFADQAFAAAVEANATDPRPLLGRLATQLRFASLLDHQQTVATLRGWADRAVTLAPLNAAVRQDYAAAIAQLGGRP